MKITDLSVKRPVTATVVYLALIVLGVFSLGRLAIDLIPDISFPMIAIFSSYEGAAPEEVEQNLTRVIENTAASASTWSFRTLSPSRASICLTFPVTVANILTSFSG